MTKRKLDSGIKHVMTLIQRDADHKGWTKVSSTLYPTISESLPAELVEFQLVGEQYYGRLTQEGIIVLKWWDRLK